MIVVVTGLPGAGKTTLARGLATLLGLPLLSLDAIKEALYDAPGGADRAPRDLRFAAEAVLGALLPDTPIGAVIDIWLDPTRGDRERLRASLPPDVARREIFCDVAAETAVRRYAGRDRHRMHRGPDAELLRRIEEAAGLLREGGAGALTGLGPVLRVDTSDAVAAGDLVAWVRTAVDEGG